jgi:hypothetical protein
MSKSNTFTPSRLARLAYGAMIENVARIQEEVVKQEAVNARFGDEALSVTRLLRGRQDNLRNGQTKRDLSSSLTRHAEYIAAIREFEALFEIEENENIEAFARAFKNRMKED